jgi:hypothetical protein
MTPLFHSRRLYELETGLVMEKGFGVGVKEAGGNIVEASLGESR